MKYFQAINGIVASIETGHRLDASPHHPDFPTTVLNILGCKLGGQHGHDWGQCNTEELCSEQGDCHGHQSHEYGRARYCGPKSPETKTANDECGHQAAATSDNTKCCSWGYKYDSGTGMCNWDLGASHWGELLLRLNTQQEHHPIQ